MKGFLDEHFLLNSSTAQKLFHGYARDMPIIDYHSHLPPREIAEDKQFENLTQAWLYGDHYKWRAMRTNGVDESFCTGEKSDWEKFEKWAATVPYTLRNPLYHWTHLELQRYFEINKILNPESALSIYSDCTNKLHTASYTVKGLLKKMKVRIICTTDDPLNDLAFHKQLRSENFEISVLPTFRPDAAMNVDDPPKFREWLSKLEKMTNRNIITAEDFLQAVKDRHDFFGSQGCKVSDHGLEEIYAEDFTDKEFNSIFSKVSSGRLLEEKERRIFKSVMLMRFAEWDWEKGWVQQFHLGALRNNNSRMKAMLGPDTGWDSIGNFNLGRSLAKFLDRLDTNGKLTRTILYNLNPADNAVMATMAGNFNDGVIPGKIQWGSAWWFLDQQDGMEEQLNVLSNMGLLSRFVGMLTDSRSFLSYPRHEYFRRILCNLLGDNIEKEELPNDLAWTGKIIQDICFHNAKNYFGW